MIVFLRKKFACSLIVLLLVGLPINKNLLGTKSALDNYDLKKIIGEKLSTYSFSDVEKSRIEIRKKIMTKILESLREEPF